MCSIFSYFGVCPSQNCSQYLVSMDTSESLTIEQHGKNEKECHELISNFHEFMKEQWGLMRATTVQSTCMRGLLSKMGMVSSSESVVERD